MRPDAFVIPGLLALLSLHALVHRVDLFAALTKGAGNGLTVLLRIFPALVALLTAISMLRASGAMEFLAALTAPLLERLGIPPETAPLMLIRPISGSGALAVVSDLIQTHGPDSHIGRVAAVMMGSTALISA